MRGGSELAADKAEHAGDAKAVKEAKAAAKGLDLEYATAWSYGINEMPNLLIPNFNGADGKAVAYVLGTAALYGRSYVSRCRHHIPFCPRTVPLQGQGQVVDYRCDPHRGFPRMGQSFYVVHAAVVQLRADVQQVQDGVNGVDGASGDGAAAWIPDA